MGLINGWANIRRGTIPWCKHNFGQKRGVAHGERYVVATRKVLRLTLTALTLIDKAPPEPEREWTHELQEDLERLLSVAEECITETELKQLVLKRGNGSGNDPFILYDGFEPSGRMHIAQGIFKAVNVNKCTNAGGIFVFWVADWFALMNDKMGGDLEKIKVVGHYLQEVWKAAGMNLEKVQFKWASDEITQHAGTYWPLMLDIARRFNITRIKKCCQIMGRLEGNLSAAQILYPLMQCCDVFFLKADICQLGLDQRKVNALAREYCSAAKRKFPPVILSHHMLYGLKAGQEKMSKSDPDSAIFMEDAAEDVERKIRNAYCPNQEEKVEQELTEEPEDAGKASMHVKVDTLKNPVLDYIENILLSREGATFQCGGVEYSEFSHLRSSFLDGTISEEVLKDAVISALNEMLEPVRQHFTNDQVAAELLAKVKEYKKLGKADAIKTIRRLDLVAQNKVPANSHLVFCPMPSKRPTLQEAVDILYAFRCASSGQPRVLLLQDWSAMVCNALDSTKAIDACFDVIVGVLKSLDGSLMETVTVIRQSDCILLDPSNYWISVINVGRKFNLAQVMGGEGDLVDSDGVGSVIHRLMSVADVTSVKPASWVPASPVVCELVREFLPDQDLTTPESLSIEVPQIRLHPVKRKGEEQDVDEYFMLDGSKEHAKSKLNKSFAEAQNVEFCPSMQLAKVFCFPDPLVVDRKEANGGPVTYETYEQLYADYESGSLHPGDLKKGGMAPIMLSVFEKIEAGLKAYQQSVKTMKAEAKKKKK